MARLFAFSLGGVAALPGAPVPWCGWCVCAVGFDAWLSGAVESSVAAAAAGGGGGGGGLTLFVEQPPRTSTRYPATPSRAPGKPMRRCAKFDSAIMSSPLAEIHLDAFVFATASRCRHCARRLIDRPRRRMWSLAFPRIS